MSIVTEVEDKILILTIDRPRKMNAIDDDTSLEISRTLMEAEADPSIQVIIVTGAGDRVFSSGADLTYLADGADSVSEFGGLTRGETSKPIIVAANGSAYGGGVEIMLSGDIVIVEQGREFAFPEVRLGIFPAAGGALKLPRLVPWSAAMDLLLSGEAVSAERFYELGLASRLVEKGKAREEALRIAAQICSHASEGVQAAKRMATISTGRILAEHWTINTAHADELLNSSETKKRLSAFVEKQRPQ